MKGSKAVKPALHGLTDRYLTACKRHCAATEAQRVAHMERDEAYEAWRKEVDRLVSCREADAGDRY